MGLLNCVLDILFPKFCFGCKRPGTYLCQKCFHQIKYPKFSLCPICEKPSPYGHTHPKCLKPYGITGLTARGDYEGLLKKTIQMFKYQNITSLAPTLCKTGSSSLPNFLSKYDLIIPIPLHPRREKERGFNQSLLLAQGFSVFLDIPVEKNNLIRIKYTKPQMSLKTIRERKNSIQKSFILLDRKKIIQKNIILVDDVATTGATIFEAARVLRENGAGRVWGLVLARKINSRYK